MKFKLKNIRKRSNTKKRKYTSRKNKKYVIESSRKYKRVAKRYYKNNTHKRNKIQNGGLKEIDAVLLLSEYNELLKLERIFTLKYSKILSNGRPTPDSLFTKPSNFAVYFFKNDPPLPLDSYTTLVSSTSVYEHYFTLKMIRHNPAKLFTVGFRARNHVPLEIKYISGVAMATEFKQQQKEQNLAVTNKTEYDKDNATELVFDKNNKITKLTITDDTGKDTYIFKEDDNKDFFKILSNIKFCFNGVI
jgi:hypothetical protein